MLKHIINVASFVVKKCCIRDWHIVSKLTRWIWNDSVSLRGLIGSKLTHWVGIDSLGQNWLSGSRLTRWVEVDSLGRGHGIKEICW